MGSGVSRAHSLKQNQKGVATVKHVICKQEKPVLKKGLSNEKRMEVWREAMEALDIFPALEFSSLLIKPIDCMDETSIQNVKNYFCDIRLTFPNSSKCIFSHKILLYSRSPYFRQLFARYPDLSEHEISVSEFLEEDIKEHITPDLFMSILTWIYSGHLNKFVNEHKQKAFEVLIAQFINTTSDKPKSDKIKHTGLLASDFSKIVNSNMFSDITFVLDSKELYGHKSLLSCRSTYFKTLFTGNFSESQNNLTCINISENSHTAFEQLLWFIYTNTFHIESLDVCLELFFLAKFHNLEAMEWHCERFCVNCVNAENVVPLWNFTLQYEDESSAMIGEKCRYYLVENVLELIKKDEDSLVELEEELVKITMNSEEMEKAKKWNDADKEMLGNFLRRVAGVVRERKGENEQEDVIPVVKQMVPVWMFKLIEKIS